MGNGTQRTSGCQRSNLLQRTFEISVQKRLQVTEATASLISAGLKDNPCSSSSGGGRTATENETRVQEREPQESKGLHRDRDRSPQFMHICFLWSRPPEIPVKEAKSFLSPCSEEARFKSGMARWRKSRRVDAWARERPILSTLAVNEPRLSREPGSAGSAPQ